MEVTVGAGRLNHAVAAFRQQPYGRLAAMSRGVVCVPSCSLDSQPSRPSRYSSLGAQESGQRNKNLVASAAASDSAQAAFLRSLQQQRHVDVKDLSEEQKHQLVEDAAERIKSEIAQRERKLKESALKAHMEHEIKFGRMMMSEGKYEVAIAHFNKVLSRCSHQSWHQGEATLQKATCYQKLGRKEEAKNLFNSLIQFRAPFPSIKRQAVMALMDMEGGINGEGRAKGTSAFMDDYMQGLLMSGFNTYHAKTQHVESQEEKTMMKLIPWLVLLMGPALLLTLPLWSKT